MFPTSLSSYTSSAFPGFLAWIPRKLKMLTKGNINTKDCIPCIIIQMKSSPIWIIYSHGNGCDIGQMFDDLKEYAKDFSANVIAFEYQGYGIYPGSPSTESCKSDNKKIAEFLIVNLNVHPNNIILFGRSIGSGIASTTCKK